jgi:hypothetical protein
VNGTPTLTSAGIVLHCNLSLCSYKLLALLGAPWNLPLSRKNSEKKSHKFRKREERERTLSKHATTLQVPFMNRLECSFAGCGSLFGARRKFTERNYHSIYLDARCNLK